MSKLSQPGKIGRLQLKNRILMAPMGTHNGNFTQETLAYFKARADGGAAMILCNIIVSDRFEDTSSSVTLNGENIDRFRELCSYAHQRGCFVCAQLMPGSGRIGGASPRFGVPISASPCGWLYAPEVSCHELTLDEIQALLKDFRATAKLAVGAGADAIEVHSYGGYLTDQFLTAAWNTRKDEYGGDLRGRARFLLELIRISQEEGGDGFPVLVKYTPDHCMPEGAGFRAMAEGLELTRLLESAGVAALHVDAGCYENWHLAMPPVYFQELTPQMQSAREVKRHTPLPVITNGRLSDIAKAEAVLEAGICDFAAIGRGLLADPELPNKVMAGKTDEIRPCISCNEGCIGQVCGGKAVGCAVNPYCGKEFQRRPFSAKTAKKILVVGAGPGGCVAALLAHAAGHTVEIWEKSCRVGGRLLAASAPYIKRDMAALPGYYHSQLLRKNIPIRFMKTAYTDNVAEFAPDAVIWAAGGVPLLPKSIPGLDRQQVCSAEDALRNLCIVGEEIVIAGGGLVGIETALHYSRMGKKVTVIEMADTILPKPPFVMNKTHLDLLLEKSNIALRPKTRLLSVEDGYVTAESAGVQEKIPCNTVLMALGVAPALEAAKALEAICPVHIVGESGRGAADVLTAVEDAYQAVAQL